MQAVEALRWASSLLKVGSLCQTLLHRVCVLTALTGTDTAVAVGNFFSAAFEDRCAAVAGASGGIFGLLGLFIADMVLNFETLTR